MTTAAMISAARTGSPAGPAGVAFGLGEQECVDVIATATSLAGALWQMATPGPLAHELYRSDPGWRTPSWRSGRG